MIKSRRGDCIDIEQVKRINENASDWTATCPICGVTLTGTPAEIRKHKHGDEG